MTARKPNGTITINDLELAEALLGFLALEAKDIPLTYTQLATFCNNMTTVVWAYKLRTSKSQIAGYLLRFLGLRIHQDQESITIQHHLSGVLNMMADIISHAFKQGQFFVASKNGLVPYFNKPPPPHAERIMDRMPCAKIPGFLRDFLSAW